MTGDDLPDDSHVVHYVKPTWILEGGSVDGSAFRLRAGESGLSVHWLECFEGLVKSQQLDEVRRRSRLKRSWRGRFAELHVDRTKHYIGEQLDGVRFVHKPSDAEGDYGADPSHSEITGLPPGDSPMGALIGDMIAECAEDTYPAFSS